MAVNKQFSGNVYNENGNTLSDIRYRGYHRNSDTWSDWYYTNTELQYNINLGDAAWLTQNGVVNTGDNVLLVFESLETNIKIRRFCMIKLTIDQNDYYINNVQLIKATAPTIVNNWYLESVIDGSSKQYIAGLDEYINVGRINEPITAYSSPNTTYNWFYDGVEHFHVETYYNQPIFQDRIAVSKKEFDWNEGYTTTINHVYTAPSDRGLLYTPVYHKVTNNSDIESIDMLKIQIRYNTPIPSATWDPRNPTVLDNLVITSTSEDIDNRSVSISYRFDGVEQYRNNILNFSWTQDLLGSYIPTHNISIYIVWDDGFVERIAEQVYTLYMTNLPPSFNVVQSNIGNNFKYEIVDIMDPDGPADNINFKWKLEYFMEFDNSYKIIYNDGYPAVIDQTPKEWILDTPGKYRITVTGKDEYDAEYTVTLETLVTATTSDCSSGVLELPIGKMIYTSVPVKNADVKNYLISKIDSAIKSYNTLFSASDVIKLIVSYDDINNKYLSYIPGKIKDNSIHNFKLVEDRNGYSKINGFYMLIKDYSALTNNNVIKIDWNQGDVV